MGMQVLYKSCSCKCRYLFNVGEGFQRFATQHQVNFKYLTDVLLTRNSSDAAGGLPGKGAPFWVSHMLASATIANYFPSIQAARHTVHQECLSRRTHKPGSTVEMFCLLEHAREGCHSLLCCAGLCLNLSDALGGFKESINRLDFYGPRVSTRHRLYNKLVQIAAECLSACCKFFCMPHTYWPLQTGSCRGSQICSMQCIST